MLLELLGSILLFIVSLAVLVKSSDFFTDAAESLGIYLGFPHFVVGVTIVSVGTSLPELLSSVFALLNDSSEIILGNVVGSNIANIFLVLGTAAVISKRLSITYDLINVDLPLFVGTGFFLGLSVWDLEFSIGEAILCLIAYGIYMFYTISIAKQEEQIKKNNPEAENPEEKKLPIKDLSILIVSSILLCVGAKYTIESVVTISKVLEIGVEIIAVTAVALGTSLPELIVTISIARKGNPEMAIGNVLGSNIFNTFVVMGVPGLIGNIVITETILQQGLPLMLVGTILFVFATQDKQVTKWEGFLFFIFYGWFIGQMFQFI
jgi:cation:H+ antiporter